MSRKAWVIVLAIWLVLWGLLAITNFKFELENFVMGALAVTAAILLLLDR